MDSIPTRLRASTPGLGEASETEIEQRAQELAQSDGRPVFSATDLLAARAELGGGTTPVVAPEIAHGQQGLVIWDGPIGEAGQQVIRASEDDEVNLGEQLVQAGMAEAEHDQRVQAEAGTEKEGGE